MGTHAFFIALIYPVLGLRPDHIVIVSSTAPTYVSLADRVPDPPAWVIDGTGALASRRHRLRVARDQTACAICR